MDHDAVDPAVEPGARRRTGPPLRGAAMGDRRVVIGDRCLEAYADVLSGAEILAPWPARISSGADSARCSRTSPTRPARSWSLARISSPWTRAPGSSRWRPGSVEDDQHACEAVGIPVICPVDDRARFTAEVGDLAGVQVFDANATIVDRLGAPGHLSGPRITPTATRTAGGRTRRSSIAP